MWRTKMKKMLLVLIALLSLSFNAFAVVNLNTASQSELEGLNGIGPAKAKAIVEYRQKNGGFKSVDDLEKVQGIGAGILKKIRNDVTIGGKALPVAVQPAKTSDVKVKAK